MDNKLKRILQIIFFSVLFILSVIAFKVFNDELGTRMESLKKDLLVFLETQIGRKIAYDSISPSIFMFLEIRNLRIFSESDSDNEIYKLKRVRVSYDIFRIFSDGDLLAAVSSIEIANTLFRISLSGETDEQTDVQNQLLRQLSLNRYNIILKGNNVDIELTSGNVQLFLPGLFFTIAGRTGELDIKINRGNLKFNLKDPVGRDLWVTSVFSLKGILSDNYAYSDFEVNIDYLSSSYLTFNRQTFRITAKDRDVEIRKIQDKAAIDLLVKFNLDTGGLVTQIKTEKFRPHEMFKFAGPLFEYNKWLNTEISCDGTVSISTQTGEAEYSMDARLFLDRSIFFTELDINTKIRGDLKKIYFDRLLVNTNLGAVDFKGNLLFENMFPEGIIRLAGFKAVPGKELNANFDVIRQQRSISLRGSRLVMGNSGFDLFNIDLYPAAGQLLFNLEASLAETGVDDFIKASGAFQPDKEEPFYLNGNLFNVPLSSFYKLMASRLEFTPGIYDALSSYLITSDLTVRSDLAGFSLSSEKVKITDELTPSNFLWFTLEATNREFRVTDLVSRFGYYTVTGGFNGGLSPFSDVVFSSDILVDGIPYSFEGTFSPGKSLSVRGKYGFYLNLRFPTAREILAEVRGVYFPIPLKTDLKTRKMVYLDLNLLGRAASDGQFEIISPEIIIYDLPLLEQKHNSLGFSCRLVNDNFEFTDVRYKDDVSSLEGFGELLFSEVDSGSGAGMFILSGSTSEERYVLGLTLTEGTAEWTVDFTESPLRRLIKSPITGNVSGSVSLKGQSAAPDIRLAFIIDKGKIVSDFVDIDCDLSFNSRGIEIHKLNLDYLDHRFSGSRGVFQAETGTLIFTSDYKADYFGRPVEAVLDISGKTLRPPGEEFLVSLLYDDFTMNLGFKDIKNNRIPGDPWTVRIERKVNTLTFFGGPENSFEGYYNTRGGFGLTVKAPFPLQLNIDGTILPDNRIDALISRIQFDLSLLNITLQEDILKFTSGSASGTNIAISGFFNDPDYFGNLRLSDVALFYSLVKEPTDPFNTNLLFQEKSMRLSNVRATLGEGALLCNGTFTIDHWIPAAFDLYFQTDRQVGAHIVSNFGVMDVDGYAIGDLRTRGNVNDLWIDGSLKINYCDLALSNTFIEEADGGTGDFHVNLEFIAGNNVQFYMPSVTLPVLNCFASQGSKIILSFDTAADSVYLGGEVSLQRGQVFYFDRDFHIRSGKMVFNERGEIFDPRLSFEAAIRERDEEGEDITIYLVMEDKKFSDFNPQFKSVPSRSINEIMAILGSSITQKLEGNMLGGLALLSSEVISQFGFFRPLEQMVRDTFNFDMFSIRTPVFQNVFEAGLAGVGMDEGMSSDNYSILGKYLDNTTITIGQSFGNDLFFTGTFRIRDAETLTGFGDNTGFLGAVPEIEFNLEWPTPFFVLEYSFTPKYEHMSDFFLSDNALKFELSYSY